MLNLTLGVTPTGPGPGGQGGGQHVAPTSALSAALFLRQQNQYVDPTIDPEDIPQVRQLTGCYEAENKVLSTYYHFSNF